MKSKALFLGLLLAAFPVAEVRADSYTITLQPGLNLIANQLDNIIEAAVGEMGDEGPGPDNRVVALFTNLPPGAYVLKYLPDTDPFEYEALTNGPAGWSDPNSPMTMEPGEGVFLFNPLNVVLPVTFSGDPHDPVLPLDLPLGSTSLLSNQTNAPATFENIVGQSPTDGTVLSRWDATNQIFLNYTNFGGVWAPAVPVLEVGEAAFIGFGKLLPNIPPFIVIPPFPRTVLVGQNVTLGVTALGFPLPTYQWLKDGVNIPGATLPTLTLNNLQAGDVAFYSVMVSNPNGNVQSEAVPLVVAPRPPAGRFTVVNVIPNSSSGETAQNPEPSIAVNPLNTQQAAISAFDFSKGGAASGGLANQPFFSTINGGTIWTDFQDLTTGDTTLAWNLDGTFLATLLNESANNTIQVWRKAPPIPPFTLARIAASAYTPAGLPDQPWTEATISGGRERIYVGFNDNSQAAYDPAKPNNKRTASVRFIEPSTGNWINEVIDRGNPAPVDFAAIRVAPVDQRVYAIFIRLASITTGTGPGQLVIVRDDNGGNKDVNGRRFAALGALAANGALGVPILGPQNRTFPFSRLTQNGVGVWVTTGTSLGHERISSRISIALDPNNSNNVVVAYTEATKVLNSYFPQLFLVHSEDGGATWSQRSSFPTNTSLPALAFTTNGYVGLLYTALSAAGNLETHFSQFTYAQLQNRFCARSDSILCTFPDNTPAPTGAPYLGDYEQLRAVGSSFFGTFSASNDPKPANFPEGVFFQRNVRVPPGGGAAAVVRANSFLTAPGDLVDNARNPLPGANGGISIDPYFFCTSALGTSNTIAPTAVTNTFWLQRPDLTCWGMDVLCTELGNSKIVADDFLLPTNSSLTGIDIWGSWLNDALDTNALFELRIWSDVAATNNTPSHPGQLLWSQIFPQAEPYSIGVEASNVCSERFFDPVTNLIVGIDTKVYRYHFPIPTNLAFTAQANTTYWLSVSAFLTTNLFGWKTCLTNDHFQDDGTFSSLLLPAPNQWTDLHYPATHPLNPLSADLAFALSATLIPPPPTNTVVVTNKWLQSPDTSPNGLDVKATLPKILADDFLCQQSGPITQITIWGSWLNDYVAAQPCFCLGIWSDVPAAGTNLSYPGIQLWTNCFGPGEYSYLPYTNGVQENFFDPNVDAIIGADTAIWQYTFPIPTNLAFVQTNGMVYWLSVTADCFDTNVFLFGWKTCPTNWGDNAVFNDLDALGDLTGPWQELLRPGTTNSLDLAFELTTTTTNLPGPGTNIVVTNKWLQIPDASTSGFDVRATVPKILADDFQCQLSGPITGITLWGSWLDDYIAPQPCFCLGIWSDVPSQGTNFSRPGVPLWSNCFFAGDYSYFPYTNANETFFDPIGLAGASGLLGPDTQIWQYNFNVPTNLAFVQTNGTIYWLSVTVDCFDTNTFLFGWKTCPTNWNDDAVYGHLDASLLPLGDWRPLIRPGTTSNSLDLAFSLTTIASDPGPGGIGPTAGSPVLSFAPSANGGLTISWTGGGTLQYATDLAGPWTSIAGASSPYVVPTALPRCFYRVIVP